MKNSWTSFFCKPLFALILTVISQLIFAQYTVQLGEPFSVDERAVPIEVVSSTKSGYYIRYSSSKHSGSYIKFFNNELQPTDQRIDLIPEYLTENHTSLGMIEIEGKLLHIVLEQDQFTWRFYRQIIDLEEYRATPYNIITEVESEGRNVSTAVMSFMMSKDSSQLNFIYSVPNKKNDLEKIRVVSFTKTLEEIDTYEYEFPFTNRQMSFRAASLLNDGRMIFFSRLYKSNIAPATLERRKQYSHVTYLLSKGELKKLDEIDDTSKHIRNIGIGVDKDQVIISGLFSTQNMFSTNGYLFRRVSLNGDLIADKSAFFDEDFFFQLEEATKGQLKKVELNKYEDPYFILSKLEIVDGTTLLVMEQLQYSNYSFISGQIAVVSLDEEGSINWTKKIGKKGRGALKYVGSMSFIRDSDLYFLYNGNKANINLERGSKIYWFNEIEENECLMLSRVNSQGELFQECVKTRNEMDGSRFWPALSKWIDSNKLLLFTQDQRNLKKQRLIKLSFD